MMLGLIVVTLLAQVVTPDGVFQPRKSPGKVEGDLGALIAEHAEQLPTGEWLNLSVVLRRMAGNRYEVDYLMLNTGGKQRIETFVEDIKIDKCPEARADAIERVRKAWAPRFSSFTNSWNPNLWGQPCASECLSVTTTLQLWGVSSDSTSAACYRCLADAKEARDKAAKEQAERERLAREALDAVDAACGEPKP
jgi:hypothetical protein